MFTPRDVDMEIINSPPTEYDIERGWRKLGHNGTVQGRTKYAFQCLHCNAAFANHRNAHQHLQRCPQLHPKKQTVSILSFFHPQNEEARTNESIVRDIIELIAVHNIPYTQLCSPQWKRFFHDINPTFVVPSTDTFNKLIKSYAVNLENKSYSNLRGSAV